MLRSETEAKQRCRFFLLRYVPDGIKNEFVNIGVVLVPPAGKLELRFARDWSRVQALDAQADTELLDGIREELAAEGDQEWLLKRIEDSFSNVLQASESKGCLTSSPVQEADALAKMYLETPRHSTSTPREKSVREAIRRKMELAFEREGVWSSMKKKILLSEYTQSDDPLKIDCGYQVKSLLKMFHATSIKTDVNAAKALAFSYPYLVEGMRQRGVQTQLTAVVEDGLERRNWTGFAMDALESRAIQIASVSDLPQLAQTAAREMGFQ